MGKRKRKNKAKQNAKNNSFTSNHSVSNISSQYSSLRNEEISQDFEENIRNIIMDYNWKERNFKRKFQFREIGYKNYYWPKISGFISHRIVYFQFNDDSSIDITSKGRTIEIRDQNEKTALLI